MQRFETLDGMRGLAAFVVVILHATQVFQLGWSPHNAYLAVDFFFCLSGFVIAHAYDKRLNVKLSVGQFLQKRLIRLYPIVVLGAFTGSILFVTHESGIGQMAFGRAILLSLSAFLLIPAGLFFHLQAYPVNNPLWSLFFEFFANVAYAVERRLGPGLLLPILSLLAFASGTLVIFAIHFHGVGQLGYNSWGTFLGGFPRVLISFFGGVIVYRYGARVRSIAIPALPILVALLVVLLVPVPHFVAAFDLVSVAFFLPAIVFLGARAVTSPMEDVVFRWVGRVSYPLYLLHLPVLVLCSRLHPASLLGRGRSLDVAIAIFMAIAVSVFVLVLLDEPLRSWLNKTWKIGQKKVA